MSIKNWVNGARGEKEAGRQSGVKGVAPSYSRAALEKKVEGMRRDLEKKVEGMRREYDAEVSALHAEVKALKSSKDETSDRLKVARRDLNLKISENRALINERNRLQGELDALYQSTSWRITHLGRKASILARELLANFRKKDSQEKINSAVVLHLYYHDTWPEISKFIRNIPDRPKLIVTVVRRDARTDRLIKKEFPEAEILLFENRGRDVLPFIDLINRGYLNGFDMVCKIHSKKSGHSEFGEVWRDDVLLKLMGSEGRVRAIAKMFAENHDVGMVGPEGYILKGDRYIGVNRDRLLEVCEKIGSSERDLEKGFIAGSMFWVRPSALKPLREIGLTREDFDDEMMQVDGTLAHVLERAFSVSARTCNMRVIGTDEFLPFKG